MASALQKMRLVLAHVSATLSLPQLLLLLTVAERPGLSVNELAELTTLSQPVVSRTLGVLIGRYEYGDGNTIQYIEQRISLEDPRRRALFLTEQGKALLEELSRVIAV